MMVKARFALTFRLFLLFTLAVIAAFIYTNGGILSAKKRAVTTDLPFYDLTQTTRKKVVYGATDYWQGQLWKELMNFTDCEYSNCISANSSTFVGMNKADVVIFALDYISKLPTLPWMTRQNQLWLIITYESSAYSFNGFKKSFDYEFNGSMTFRRDSTIYYPWGKTIPLEGPSSITTNFALGKKKGAFAYISNCKSMKYDRLATIDILSKYIDIDVFGKCKNLDPPCPPLRKGGNPVCETQAHKDYRFFLSFENSLCQDYITEKFWDRLKSSSHFLPVAMGGLSLEDYTRVTPPNSFLHVYNFSSVEKLGEYMKYLTENDEAYNRYHQWRYQYDITTDRNIAACALCKLANEKPPLPSVGNLAEWWNADSNCRSF